jgi:transcriptional regulator with XRE-family HTH domain
VFAACQVNSPWRVKNLCSTPKPPEEVFLSRLEELEAKVGGTANVAAGLAGVHPSTWSNWSGRKRPINPTMKTLLRIAEALEIPVTAMLSDEADPRPREGLDAKDVRRLLNGLRDDLRDGVGAAVDRLAAKLPERKRGQ